MSEKPYQITIKFSRRGDEKLIEWAESLKVKHINRSALIKEILLDRIEGGSTNERLDRIETMLKSGQFSLTQAPAEEETIFDDMILDSVDL